MTVLILERAPPGVRGELTRWLLEVRAGVFVGTVAARVRDKLWELACKRNVVGAVLMIHRARNEQGFSIRTFGDTSREIVDWEGLQLVSRRPMSEDEEGEAGGGSARARRAPRGAR